ncbi:MAG: DUF2065 domain-containing protein [Polaromonas sp.]|jgi:hypothetical protein|uniref:DUF2065 domain-containing protein n=1 Tax=Polaromonas sp. TaxID=1869339 RepID=UPI002727308E|nr:DUF2065 domain-containing protein [Polaromonas sp.]MDO9190836.1 DUF2065 domain-containing protein [Sulfurimicrobium sp.]MDO9114428.1 DUF2065 domain-containing protein [Polaromonas sp.]MDP1703957.1 DUF2065 domain-containing protein [Sulfurimicrobium sp.]MDP1898111.1 DUF2065 domain-containing protein [Sulfurimicrobium sp.]MDP2198989.1 DUF2065 domain-containing protein [Sulfurimicrobium sp.]
MQVNLLAAFALMLILEGLLPFMAPAVWRETFRKMTELSDGQLRFIGLGSMLGGLIVLFLVK